MSEQIPKSDFKIESKLVQLYVVMGYKYGKGITVSPKRLNGAVHLLGVKSEQYPLTCVPSKESLTGIQKLPMKHSLFTFGVYEVSKCLFCFLGKCRNNRKIDPAATQMEIKMPVS